MEHLGPNFFQRFGGLAGGLAKVYPLPAGSIFNGVMELKEKKKNRK